MGTSTGSPLRSKVVWGDKPRHMRRDARNRCTAYCAAFGIALDLDISPQASCIAEARGVHGTPAVRMHGVASLRLPLARVPGCQQPLPRSRRGRERPAAPWPARWASSRCADEVRAIALSSDAASNEGQPFYVPWAAALPRGQRGCAVTSPHQRVGMISVLPCVRRSMLAVSL